MYKLQCNQPVYIDVDDTLLMWGFSHEPFHNSVKVINVGITFYLKPHNEHINQLKAHKARGHTIIVWSKGGADWAEAAVKALGLEEFVDLVVEKPQWCYDDTEYNEFLPKRYFLEDKK